MISKIEQTKRDMYSALDRIRRAKKHRKMTDEFESALEAHLQAINAIADQAQQDAITARQENYDIQRRMQGVDHAYTRSQEEMKAIGDVIRGHEETIREQLRVIGELTMQIREMRKSEDEANMRLIAAAPDLLSALEFVMRVISDPECAEGIALGSARAKATAAIARAKGEAS